MPPDRGHSRGRSTGSSAMTVLEQEGTMKVIPELTIAAVAVALLVAVAVMF
jgi:hypothetical protein